MNDATRIAQRILDEQGYLVMAHWEGPKLLPKVGEVLDDDEISGVRGPFMVTGEASADDFIAQVIKFYPPAFEVPTRRRAQFALGFFKLVAE